MVTLLLVCCLKDLRDDVSSVRPSLEQIRTRKSFLLWFPFINSLNKIYFLNVTLHQCSINVSLEIKPLLHELKPYFCNIRIAGEYSIAAISYSIFSSQLVSRATVQRIAEELKKNTRKSQAIELK